MEDLQYLKQPKRLQKEGGNFYYAENVRVTLCRIRSNYHAQLDPIIFNTQLTKVFNCSR
jgi:hypothetical protein